MALQTVLRAALEGAPSSNLSSEEVGGEERSPERTVSTPPAEPPLLERLRVAVLAGTEPSRAAAAAAGAAAATAPTAVDGASGNSGNSGKGLGRQRLGWVLRLACHRDATVRALALGLLAEIAGLPSPSSSPLSTTASRRPLGSWAPTHENGTPERGSRSPPELAETGTGGENAGEDEQEQEEVRSCVRAALDGDYESPAVITEALRFLCRWVFWWALRKQRVAMLLRFCLVVSCLGLVLGLPAVQGAM